MVSASVFDTPSWYEGGGQEEYRAKQLRLLHRRRRISFKLQRGRPLAVQPLTCPALERGEADGLAVLVVLRALVVRRGELSGLGDDPLDGLGARRGAVDVIEDVGPHDVVLVAKVVGDREVERTVGRLEHEVRLGL